MDLDPATYRDRFPHELSGGQQQRVGVARALAASPQVLLMDEPFGALDPEIRRQLQQEFRRWVRELGTTTIFVTHDVDEAVTVADQVAILGAGCSIQQMGRPIDVLARPANEAVRSFLGSERLLRALSVIPVTDAIVADRTNASASVPWTATAHDALAVLLQDDAVVVDVIDDAGGILGQVDWESLRDAARRAQEL